MSGNHGYNTVSMATSIWHTNHSFPIIGQEN